MKRLLLLATLLAAFTSAFAAERRPNVVLILIDDFGYECVTANGGESYRTPVMDRLAATGVRFEHPDLLAASAGGKLLPGTRTATLVKMQKRPVHLAISGRTMEFDGKAQCLAGCN